ncbi:hypothetical protein M422DRAFT_234604, partial [Sphaerobolus stellatus SS14]
MPGLDDGLFLQILLRTGQVPTKIEGVSLQAAMDEQRKQIIDLEERITRTRAQLDTFQEEKLLSEGKFTRMNSLFAPIRKIPTDILSRILLECLWLYESEEEDEYATSGNTPPLLFLRVCFTWRRVALATPRLF